VEDTSDENPRKRKVTSPSKQTSQEIIDNMAVDIVTKDFYAQWAQMDTADESLTIGTSVEQRNRQRKKDEIIVEIKKEVDEYIRHCQSFRFIKNSLDKYGNDKYKKKPNNGFDEQRVTEKMMDGHYAHKYFDIMAWWSEEGNRRFGMVATAAAVVIGKPSHNGFQERVFSRGTYFDSALKQRMKEENFEMAVLNSLTQTKVRELTEKMLWDHVEMKVDESNVEVSKFYNKELSARPGVFPVPEIMHPIHGSDSDDEGEHSDIAEGFTLTKMTDDDDISVNS
jgi:hypothetical protein